MGEHEHRCVVGRILTPPAAPLLGIPLAADRAEHVASHDTGAAGLSQFVVSADVSLVPWLVGLQMPCVYLHSVDPDRVVAALIRPSNEPSRDTDM
jgi:hypothetical protein